MEHVIRIPHKCHDFFLRQVVTLVSLKVPSGSRAPPPHPPVGVHDDHVPHLSHLDGAVGARPAEGVRGVDGGGRQRLGQGQAQVHAGQVHHGGLKKKRGKIFSN